MTTRAARVRQRIFSRAFFVVVALAYVLIPLTLIGWTESKKGPIKVYKQVETPVATIDPADLARYTAYAKAEPATNDLLILTYHDIREVEEPPYTITPETFESHMAMLSAAGFHTARVQDLIDYADGKPVPPRTVLITFDDGTHGTWIYADKILERYNFNAVSFVITRFVGTHRPYYLTWNEISRMSQNGRWEFGGHTAELHTLIEVEKGKGKTCPALICRIPVEGQDRLETMAEFEARIDADTLRSVDDLVSRNLPKPRLFAYPYSAASRNSNDPVAAEYAREAMLRTFDVAFLDDTDFRYNTPLTIQQRMLHRFDVGESPAPIVFMYLTMQPAPEGYVAPATDSTCPIESSDCPSGG